MLLLTKQIVKNFEKQGRCDSKNPEDVKIIVKFFNPTGRGSWYATEWYPTTGLFFGFVSIFNDHNDELGYFSLEELQDMADLANLEIIEEPVDERSVHENGHVEPGQWNIVFRKKEK